LTACAKSGKPARVSPLVVVLFSPNHQTQARQLIVSGLAERWGVIDD